MLVVQNTPYSRNENQIEIHNTNQTKFKSKNKLIETTRVPRGAIEFRDRIQYAQGLLDIANKLGISETSQDKINEAYKKADKAQEGLYYANDFDSKSLEEKFLKKKIACLNRKTGELTLSKETAKHYRVGQELLFSKMGADLAQNGWYSWDKKTNAAIELPSDAVFYDHVNKFIVHCKDFAKKLIDENYPYVNKTHVFIKITKISVLKKEQAKEFLKTLSVPELIPLFNISDEMQKAQQNKPIINQKFDKDLGGDHPILKKWQEESLIDPTIEKIENVDPNNTNGNIYIFGTHKEAPTSGIYNKNKHEEKIITGSTYDSLFGFYETYYNRPTIEAYDILYPGNHLPLSKNNFKDIGRTEENNFLSNAYQKDLVIPGDAKSPYKSIHHYLICKRIEKALAEAESKGNKDQIIALKELEKLINSARNVFERHRFYQRYLDINQIFPFYFRKNMFYDLDNELKKALFYKFVGLDGKPNEEGRKLLATGNVNLFAGYEIGDGSYGMRFIDYNISTGARSMEGSNKLGKGLMELREMLRELEKV